MKKTLLLLALFAGSLLSANAQTASEYLSAYVKPGAQKKLAIQLKNGVEYTACQMTITLPEGMTFAGDAVLSSRSNAHQIKSQRSSDNKSMTVVLFSYEEVDGTKTGNLPFKSDKGAVLLADLNVTGTLNTNVISGINLSDVKFVKIADFKENEDLTLNKTGILGDVNRSGDITTVDATYILKKYSGSTPTNYDEEAEDVNVDGIFNTVDATTVLKAYSYE